MKAKEYIGDSVYAEINDENQIVLTTENGYHATNTIFLEREVLDALNAFVNRDTMVCGVCGERFSLGDLDAVVFHETHVPKPDIQYSGAKRVDPLTKLNLVRKALQEISDAVENGWPFPASTLQDAIAELREDK